MIHLVSYLGVPGSHLRSLGHPGCGSVGLCTSHRRPGCQHKEHCPAAAPGHNHPLILGSHGTLIGLLLALLTTQCRLVVLEPDIDVHSTDLSELKCEVAESLRRVPDSLLLRHRAGTANKLPGQLIIWLLLITTAICVAVQLAEFSVAVEGSWSRGCRREGCTGNIAAVTQADNTSRTLIQYNLQTRGQISHLQDGHRSDDSICLDSRNTILALSKHSRV